MTPTSVATASLLAVFAVSSCYVEPEHHPREPPPPQGETVVEQVPPPPPPQPEPAPPPPPAPDQTWVTGSQRWNGRAYEWQQGHYERRPNPNAQYVQGHWEHRGQGNAWVDGHWQ